MSMDPTQRVSYQPGTGEAAASRAKFSEGWVAAVVTQAKPKQSKEKPDLEVSPRYLALNYQFKPLRDPDDPSSTVPRGIFRWQGLPIPVSHWAECFENADQYSEEQQEEFEKWKNNVNGFFCRNNHEVLRALCPDKVVALPYFEDGAIYQDGEVIFDCEGTTQEEQQDAYRAAKAKVYDEAGKLGEAYYYGEENPSELEGRTVFIYLKYKAGKREPEVERVRGEWPEEEGQRVEINTGKDVLAGKTVEETGND